MQAEIRSSSDVTDQELLQAFIEKGSDSHFTALVRRHAPWIFAAGYRQLKDPHLAEDATQMVFIALIQRAGKLRRHPSLVGWLFRTLNYTVRNIRRIERRRKVREYQAAAERNECENPHPLVTAALANELDQAVAKISETDRAIVLLRFYREQSLAQIARILGITEAAARKRLSRAIDSLRRLLRGNVSSDILSMAALQGLNQCRPDLIQSISIKALGAKSAAVHSLSSIKGAAYLMSTAKTKVVAIALVLMLGLTVPVVVGTRVVRWLTAAPEIQGNKDSSTDTSRPDIDLSKVYSLPTHQIVEYLLDPPSQARQDFFDKLAATGVVGNSQFPPEAMMIEFKNGQLAQWTWDFEKPFSLREVAQYLLEIYPPQVEGTRTEELIPGDFLFAADSTVEERRAALQKILQDNLGEPITLTFRRVQREVLVLQGRWHYVPAASPRTKSWIAPTLEIYAQAINKIAVNAGAGDAKRFAGDLGGHLGKQVIIEASGMPTNLFWAYDEPSMAKADVALILNHITEQTGLSWEPQSRMVERLFIERSSNR